MLKEEGQHFRFADACGEFFQRIFRYLQNPVYVEDEREFSSLPYGKSNPSSTLQESSIKKKENVKTTICQVFIQLQNNQIHFVLFRLVDCYRALQVMGIILKLFITIIVYIQIFQRFSLCYLSKY